MDIDLVSALRLAGAFVCEDVLGSDFIGGEGEGEGREEEKSGGEGGEVHR